MSRADGRSWSQHRDVVVDVGFQRNAEGSVLYRAGRTVVLCTASIEPSVPAWMKDSGKGWITAEYQMHPRSAPEKRESRDGRGKAPSGRTQEIQRLIGRALRAGCDLPRLGERSIVVDCDVLEADGGTRTASVTGGFIALAIALGKLRASGALTQPVLRDQVAAISVGMLDGAGAPDDGPDGIAVDLVYTEDSKARVDLNLVSTASGAIIEVQGTAEGAPVPRSNIDRMVDVGLEAVRSLAAIQRAALERSDIDLAALIIG